MWACWRSALALVALAVSPVAALATEREIAGRFGYLGEWEISGSLAADEGVASPGRAYSGAIVARHAGLCGPGGPEEKAGRISVSLRPGRAGGAPRYSARLTLAGEACEVQGTLSQEQHSFAACGSAQVPLRLWLR